MSEGLPGSPDVSYEGMVVLSHRIHEALMLQLVLASDYRLIRRRRVQGLVPVGGLLEKNELKNELLEPKVFLNNLRNVNDRSQA